MTQTLPVYLLLEDISNSVRLQPATNCMKSIKKQNSEMQNILEVQFQFLPDWTLSKKPVSALCGQESFCTLHKVLNLFSNKAEKRDLPIPPPDLRHQPSLDTN